MPSFPPIWASPLERAEQTCPYCRISGFDNRRSERRVLFRSGAVVGGAMGADGAISGQAIVTPCGRCRQIMNEAEQMAGRTLAIYCAAPEGDALVEHRVAELLPHAFGPADLGITPGKS